MLQLTFCCGLRPGECRLLKTEDLDLDNGVLLIRQNKLHNERYVPMSSSVADMCAIYKHKLQLYFPDSEYFFPNPHGIPYTSAWFKMNFKYLLKKAFPKSNVKARIYDLRHRFATTVLMNWLNECHDINAFLPYLCIYMGHSNLNSTAYYIHLLPENLVKSSSIDWNHFNSLIPKVLK
jgi:integrase